MKSTLSWPRSPPPCAILLSSSTRKIVGSRGATLTPATAGPASSAGSANARCSTSNSRCSLTTSFAVPPALPCSTPSSLPPAASSSTAPPRASPNSPNLSPSEWLPQSCDLAEQPSREHFFADFEISGDFEKDTAERADLQCTMRRNCNLVFCALRSGSDTNVASGLTDLLVTIPAQQPGELRAGKITRQFHATMTSSFTICSRMSLGLFSFSK